MNGSGNSAPIRLVIVDDHPLLLEGTRALLAQAGGLQVVGATGEGRVAIQLVQRLRPDVLLLDLHLPDISGVEVVRQVRSLPTRVAVLVLTGYDDVGYARELFRLGVQGYLPKTASRTELVGAIRAVASGGKALAAEGTRATEDAVERLTTREREVLQLVMTGRRNSEIADSLNVSVKTVEFHVGHVLEKFGVRSRTEAVIKARHLGLPAAELKSGREDG